ncbi:MAG: hypothetical protein U0793_02795 [Gemmataceae bacterium]
MPKRAKADVADADDEILDKFAKWHIWRLAENGGTAVSRARVINELETQVITKEVLDKLKENKEFVRRFSPLLVKRLNDIFATLDMSKNTPTILYAGQMLPAIAKLKHESIGDYLVHLIKDDKYHPLVRMYAARGLKEFMPVRHYVWDLFPDEDRPKKARDIEYIETLSSRIEGKWPRAKMDDNAIRYIRRDLIAALAEAQEPAVAAFKETPKKGGFGVAEGSPVPTLMRVLTPGAIDPPPDFFEKYEAASGLCRLWSVEHRGRDGLGVPAVPDYMPEAGIYLVGRFLVELSDAYSKELNEIAGPMKKLSTVPWKVYAENFKHVRDAKLKNDASGLLEDLQERMNGPEPHQKAAYLKAKGLATVAGPVLHGMTQHVTVIESSRELRDYVTKLRPKMDEKTGEFQLFKSVKGPSLKLP